MQKLWEKFPQDVGENELVNNQFMKLGIIVLEPVANVFRVWGATRLYPPRQALGAYGNICELSKH